MSEPSNTPLIPDGETFLIYRDDQRHVNHLPGPNPGTPYTVCGLDAGAMQRDEHPITHAALWCSDCMRRHLGLNGGGVSGAPSVPYYEDDFVTIYHGRAEEHAFADGRCVITDPPYGFGAYPSDVRPQSSYLFSLVSEHKTAAIFGYPEALIRLCVDWRIAPDEWVTWWPTNAIVGRTNKLNRESECVAIWGQVNATSLTQPRSVESVQIAYGHNSVKNKTHRIAGDVWRDPKPGMAFNAHLRLHPNEKPVSLMAKLVTLCSDVGDVVFDPFCGSGPTLRAAKDLGRRAVGVEVEERYCEIAARRCAQEVLVA